MKITRLCIYPKDVGLITGKTERYGRYMIKEIKTFYKKEDHQLVTIEEFCQYTGIPEEKVYSRLIP